MIVVTGGAGFIGSALIWKLNDMGFDDIVVVDHMGSESKWKNLSKRRVSQILHKDEFFQWLRTKVQPSSIEAIFHMGACSTTTERNVDYLFKNNLQYSIELHEYATQAKVPFFYASSAATYGMGENGFGDDLAGFSRLRPINPYGYSKHLFDSWVLKQRSHPPVWMGFKFFNVYGPQEYHKGSQASVVMHALPQIVSNKSLKLFKSYRPDYRDGEQKRDFVYVKDVVNLLVHVHQNSRSVTSGIYNLGTGQARTWSDLGRAVFAAAGVSPAKFEWIEMPEALRSQYQYFTEATTKHLRAATGYELPFATLEDGIRDYVKSYLMKDDLFL